MLSEHQNTHKEIKSFLKYCQDLSFHSDPDYDYLRSLLIKLSAKTSGNSNYDKIMAPDWMIKACMIEEFTEVYQNIQI